MQAWFEKAVAKFEGKPSKDQEEQWDKIEAEAEACSDKIKEAEREKQGAASLAVMKKLKDEMCACADEACSDKVHDKLTEQWKTDARVAPTDAQAQEISAITEEISKCRLNAIAPGAIPPADPAAAPAPPVP
jgi:hypothetical protein